MTAETKAARDDAAQAAEGCRARRWVSHITVQRARSGILLLFRVIYGSQAVTTKLHHEINDLQFASIAGGLDYQALANSLTTEGQRHSASRTASPDTYQSARNREQAMLTAIQSILNIWRLAHPKI